jgi:hypothetical protein
MNVSTFSFLPAFYQQLDLMMAILTNAVVELPVYSVPVTTKVVSSIPAHDEIYLIQHYVIKFVGDLRQVGGFLQLLRFPPPINLTRSNCHVRKDGRQ